MDHADFKMGMKFLCGTNDTVWKVTDVGSRVVVAIKVKSDWMSGPPYAQDETVFDESDFPVCDPAPGDDYRALVKTVIEERKLTQRTAAELMGVSLRTLEDLLRGRSEIKRVHYQSLLWGLHDTKSGVAL